MCQLFPPNKDWIDILSALITPVVAVIGIYIAYQQRNINKNRLKHELFEKRHFAYTQITNFVSSILLNGRVKDGADIEFLRDTKSVSFLFDDAIKRYIGEIYKKAVDLHSLISALESVTDMEERTCNLNDQQAIKDWYENELKTMEWRFMSFLKLEN